MKMEFLYFDGCPNHETALANFREVLSEVGLSADIVMINITNHEDAATYRFLGSPSIRINGKDLEITEDSSTEYSMRCRRYRNGDVMEGFPTKELIKANLPTPQGD